MPDNKTSQKRTVTEEVEVFGGQIVERVQELIRQGNVRRIIIRTADDRVLVDTTLTVGVVAGGTIAFLTNPVMIAIAAVAVAVVGRVKIEIIREVTGEDIIEGAKSRVKIEKEDAKPKKQTKTSTAKADDKDDDKDDSAE